MAPAHPSCVETGNSDGIQQHSSSRISCVSNCEDAISGMEAFLQKHTKRPDVLPHDTTTTTKTMTMVTTTPKPKAPKPLPVIRTRPMNMPIEEIVDIMECSNARNINKFTTNCNEDPDATEYSSSFGDTGSDNGSLWGGFSEAEVESQCLGDNIMTSAFDPFTNLFPMRKKKLTSHWQKFIRPLMWRCKWTELKINQLKSQESIYGRKQAAFCHQKSLDLDQSRVEDFGTKSFSISSYYRRKKAMKRRKRKRIEDKVDIASYMSRHNLFSYIENKRPDLDGTSAADDMGNTVFTDPNAPDPNEFGTNDDHAFFYFNGGEDSFEWILCKIERAWSKVQILKTQVGDVMFKHGVKFSSSENLSLIGTSDVQTSSDPCPTFSAGYGDIMSSLGGIYSSTHHISECDDMGDDYMGDLVMPENAISGYGKSILVPDITESTADITLPQLHTGDSCDMMLDTLLSHDDQTAELERHSFQKPSDHHPTEHQDLKRGEQEENSKISTPELNVETKPTIFQEQSTLKSLVVADFPKNKGKRGERKACSSGAWSLKNTPEPDNKS